MLGRRFLLPALLAGLALLPASAFAAGPVGKLSTLNGSDRCIQESSTVLGCKDTRASGGPHEPLVAPDGRHLYAAASDTDSVFGLTRDPIAGTIAQTTDAAGCIADDQNVPGGVCVDGKNLNGAIDLAVPSSGAFIYAATVEGVVALRRDGSSGRLDMVNCVSMTGGATGAGGGLQECVNGRVISNATGIAIAPDGKHLYVSRIGADTDNDAVAILPINAQDGSISQPEKGGGCVRRNGNNGTIEGQTDSPTPGFDTQRDCSTQPIRGLGTPKDVAVAADGLTVYVANSNGVVVLKRDPASGQLTQPAGAAGCVTATAMEDCGDGRALDLSGSLTLSPDRRDLYVLSSNGVARFAIGADGTLTQPGDATGCATTTGSTPDGPGACTVVRAIGELGDIQASPDGASVVVTGRVGPDGDTLAILDRAADGSLSQTTEQRGCVSDTGAGGTCETVDALFAGNGAAFSAEGEHLYTAGPEGITFFRREVAPTCGDQAASVTAGGAVTIQFSCSDRNGDAVSLGLAPNGQPTVGSATVDATAKTVTYTVGCGNSGIDTVLVRPFDGTNYGAVRIATITIGANACPPPPPPPPTGNAPAPRLVTRTLRPDAKNRVRLRLECAKSAPVNCRGKIDIFTVKVRTSNKKKRKKRLLIMSQSYDIAPGKNKILVQKVKKDVKKALKIRKGRINLQYTLRIPANGLLKANTRKGGLTLRSR